MPTYHPALSDLNWVHPAIEHELFYAVERALEAGAQAPLEYLGAGAYGIVFQDQEHRAFKVARHFRPGKLWLEQDFEWMAFARQVPAVAPHVVRPFAYDDERDIIIMEAIDTRTELPSGGTGSDTRTFRLHERLCDIMRSWGFGCPEYKKDAYVYHPKRGPVLVDVGLSSIRYGWRLARQVQRMLSGIDPLPRESYELQGLVWALGTEAKKQRISPAAAEKLASALKAVMTERGLQPED